MNLVLAHCQLQGGEGAEAAVSGVGVNWGAIASHPMEPHIVVNLLKENVSAFSGTDIEVMVGIPNDQLKKLSKDLDHAEDWVKQNVSKHAHDEGVNIRRQNKGDHGALNDDVYESSFNKPSDGSFRKNIYDVMKQLVKFLDEKKSPFLVNIYSFLNLYQNEDFPKDYAFFEGHGKSTDDKNAHYTNMFYQGFLKKMASNKGTLLHPGPVNSYLVSLFDENMKSVAPDDFERHWGIFHYDGKPEFPIDFSGKGEDKMPIGTKGVRYQEQKWCVLKSNANRSELGGYLSYACAGGDCTSLGNLDASGNASYAFNQYFQINDQSVEACDFEGVATIASKENVFFPCINHQ
ncbi:Glucan endo-1,3-beta-glucosidase 6 [Glycine soja]|uniref:glucan endo-1,3-beta-D-glucosidase n=1 Tax=Glycine soja TaxID=3848 RepID=A0A445JEN3_GLYSO|nr:Glucan endo-1,3-beta-glucosidase 6 [Glycine soja]